MDENNLNNAQEPQNQPEYAAPNQQQPYSPNPYDQNNPYNGQNQNPNGYYGQNPYGQPNGGQQYPYGQNPYEQAPQQAPQPAKKGGLGLSIAGFALGLLSMIEYLSIYFYLNIIGLEVDYYKQKYSSQYYYLSVDTTAANYFCVIMCYLVLIMASVSIILSLVGLIKSIVAKRAKGIVFAAIGLVAAAISVILAIGALPNFQLLIR